MFKFSRLVSKASEPINLRNLMKFQKSKLLNTSNSSLKSSSSSSGVRSNTPSKRVNKCKNNNTSSNRKLKKKSFALMESLSSTSCNKRNNDENNSKRIDSDHRYRNDSKSKLPVNQVNLCSTSKEHPSVERFRSKLKNSENNNECGSFLSLSSSSSKTGKSYAAIVAETTNKVLTPNSSSNALNNFEQTENVPSSMRASNSRYYNRVYSGFRKWERMEASEEYMNDYEKNQCNYGNGLNFTLMSYNILAQDLLEHHPHLYYNHNQSALNWGYRLGKLAEEIVTLRPELLCLQEVQNNHLDDIKESLNGLRYEHVFKKKTGSRTDGCAIFYNRDLFSLVDKHAVEYYQPGFEHLDRENVGLIVKLCLKTDPTACFILSTTHLLYNPRRQDVRLAQIQVLLAELDRLSVDGFHPNSNTPKRLPIILTGDFNLQPYSSPYNLITTGNLIYYNLTNLTLENPYNEEHTNLLGRKLLSPKLGITDNCQHIDLILNKYQGRTRLHHSEQESNNEQQTNVNNVADRETENDIEARRYPELFSTGRLTHGLNLTSVYQHENYYGREASTYQNEWITVDYIFYTKHFMPHINSICSNYLKLLSRYNLPTVNECYRMGQIPNLDLGSDHLSLTAEFRLEIPFKP